MNVPFFISKRISSGSPDSFSQTISHIAVVSIGLGLTVLILAFMVLFGFKREIQNKIYSFSGHLIINKYTLSTSFEETSITLGDELLAQLNEFPLTEHVQPYAMKAALLKTEEEVQGVIIKGIDSSFDTTRFRAHLTQGRMPDFSGEGYTSEVVISERIANYLELSLSDEVLVYFVQTPPRFRRLKVTGMYATGLEEFDEKIILGDLGLIRRINDWPDSVAGGVEVFISDTDKMQEATDDLYNQLDIDLYVGNVHNRYIQIFDWLNLLNRNVVILLVIILAVSGTSIISILLILIMERTRMIGVLKAMGASNNLIRRIFLVNGVQLILRGLFWGNGIGLGLGLLQAYFKIIPLDASNYYMDHVPIVIDIPTILGLNLLVLMIIGLTLLVPVAIISNVKPVKAIRFD